MGEKSALLRLARITTDKSRSGRQFSWAVVLGFSERSAEDNVAAPSHAPIRSGEVADSVEPNVQNGNCIRAQVDG